MKYEEMSDFEINLAAAKSRYHQVEFTAEKEWVAVMGSGYSFDPCNNPLDAWPIITENMISIEFDGEDKCDEPSSWVNAKSFLTDDVCLYQSNPLRAAMICFLKMKDAECKN